MGFAKEEIGLENVKIKKRKQWDGKKFMDVEFMYVLGFLALSITFEF